MLRLEGDDSSMYRKTTEISGPKSSPRVSEHLPRAGDDISLLSAEMHA